MTEYEKQKYKMYLQERKILIESIRENSRSFEKIIIALSSGAFGLSLTFLKYISNLSPNSLNYLKYSWTFFICSLTSILFSLLSSSMACQRQIILLDNQSEKKNSCDCNNWTYAVQILNVLSIIFFIIAIIY